MKIKTLYSQIVAELRAQSDQTQAEKDKVYHKKGYKSYGLKIPQVGAVIRNFKPIIGRLPLGEKFDLAELFYISGCAEEGHVGNAILTLGIDDIKPEHFSRIDKLLGYFNNWDEVDNFSINVMQTLLNRYTKDTLNLLNSWNRSKNMRKRRASVVVFVRKVGASGSYTDVVFEFCDKLLCDEEDLVLKAVGWVLKDNIVGSKKRVIDYIKDLRRSGVSSVITLYAIRAQNDKERKEILDVRQAKKGGDKL